MAFVVELGGKMVAVGRYDRMEDDPTVAEVAFVVEDGHQGRGIGTQLLTHLTNYARNNGVTAFRAFVLPDNYPMMRVFRSSGFQLRREMGQGIYTVEFPVELTDEAKRAAWQHEQQAVAASLLPMFYPRSVAIVGASREERSIGARVMRNTLRARFSGVVYPVNPNAPAVGSVKAYKSVLDIPDAVDMAVIVVPARFVLPVVQECADKGVKALVVISAGFSEIGEEGTKLETELLELVRSAGMRMVGPNCMGMLNTDPAVNLDVTFAPNYPPRGNVAMSSQSGALGIAILDYARQLDIGISSFVSMGNKADVSANDLLLYWEGDPSTDVILLYLESFGHPRRFARISRRVNRKKPIVVVKSGRSQAGARAASSHTGVHGQRRGGGLRPVPPDRDDPHRHARGAVRGGHPAGQPAAARRAGGWRCSPTPAVPGILAADALSADGLELPLFSPGPAGEAAGGAGRRGLGGQPGGHDRLGQPRPVPGLPAGAARLRRDRLGHGHLHPHRAPGDPGCGAGGGRRGGRGHQRQDGAGRLHGGRRRRPGARSTGGRSASPPTPSPSRRPGPWLRRCATPSGGPGPRGSSPSSTTPTPTPPRTSSGGPWGAWAWRAAGCCPTRPTRCSTPTASPIPAPGWSTPARRRCRRRRSSAGRWPSRWWPPAPCTRAMWAAWPWT